MTFPPESDLNFDFNDAKWTNLLHFDKTTEYRNAQEALPGTKGVDFTGILENHSIVIMEVKNFRGHRIENKPRIEGGDDPVWLEAAKKIRDSVSVVVGSARNSTHLKETWQRYLEIMGSEKKYIHFVLWLEQDMPDQVSIAKPKSERNEIVLRRNLKKSLRWLTPRVDIANVQNNPFPQALTVTYL
jgi:hypothetical protein